jgi:hypothetical protein
MAVDALPHVQGVVGEHWPALSQYRLPGSEASKQWSLSWMLAATGCQPHEWVPLPGDAQVL